MIKHYGIVSSVGALLILAGAVMTIFNVDIGMPGRSIYVMTLLFIFWLLFMNRVLSSTNKKSS